MLLGIPVEHFTTLANFMGLALLGLLALVGARRGEKSSSPKGLQVAGALVDSKSVNKLTEAIDALSKAYQEMSIAYREDSRAREELTDALFKASDQLRELRNEIARRRD